MYRRDLIFRTTHIPDSPGFNERGGTTQLLEEVYVFVYLFFITVIYVIFGRDINIFIYFRYLYDKFIICSESRQNKGFMNFLAYLLLSDDSRNSTFGTKSNGFQANLLLCGLSKLEFWDILSHRNKIAILVRCVLKERSVLDFFKYIYILLCIPFLCFQEIMLWFDMTKV